MRSVEQHLDHCLSVAPKPRVVTVPLEQAVGMVSAAEVRAEIALPTWDVSAMDGYALAWGDIQRGSATVTGQMRAGGNEHVYQGPGTAVQIMTGAPVPVGADTVIPVEKTDQGGWGPQVSGTDTVRFTSQVAQGANIRRAGEAYQVGDLLMPAHTVFTSRHLGLLASAGVCHVQVWQPPSVAVLSTGDELINPGEPLAFGQVYNSNSIMIQARCAELGVPCTSVQHSDDNPATLMTLLTELATTHDVLITCGGVSMGVFDVVKEALSEHGTVTFHQVAMQPGKPQGVGTWHNATVYCLPGNPVSVLVSFEAFVRPALRTTLQRTPIVPTRVPATATRPWNSAPGKAQFSRVNLMWNSATHRWEVEPMGGAGSHLVSELAEANALAVIAPEIVRVAVGDVVWCQPFAELPLAGNCDVQPDAPALTR